MFSIMDFFRLIPNSLKQSALDALVDAVVERGESLLSEGVLRKIRKLRSDTGFQEQFDVGLKQGIQRFVDEYQLQDEDLVSAIGGDADFFQYPEIRNALLSILRHPGDYLTDDQDKLTQSFESVLPKRINRERVDKAVSYFLKCLARELWHLPELMPIYSFEFQRITAESTHQQLEVQKAQLQALTNLGSEVREGLLQLTEVLVQQKLLTNGEPQTRPSVLHNLPQPDFEKFIGRETELAEVKRILRPYPHSQVHLVTIDGVGGVGKSALALEVAHQYLYQHDQLPKDERFEAIIWTSAKRTVLTGEGIQTRYQSLRTLDDIYRAIAVALERQDIFHAQAKDQNDIVRQALTRQRTLLIIDNLETVDDQRVVSFLRELPAPTKAIVTTRHLIDMAYSVHLTGMPWTDAKEIIDQECEKKGIYLNLEKAKRLYERTGGIPLAIVWSIAQMGFGYSVNVVLRRLGTRNNDIAYFCFQGAIELVRGKPAHKLLMALSMIATDANREALEFVTDLPELDCDDGLVELEKLSLVNKRESRFFLLPLTKIFATAETDDNSHFKQNGIRRWLQYFRNLSQETEPIGAYYRRFRSLGFHREGENILDAIEWAYTDGTSEDVFVLTRSVHDYLEVAGEWNQILVVCERALELAISQSNLFNTARFANMLGWINYQQGDYNLALIRIDEALSCYRKENDLEGIAISLQYKSSVYRKQKQYTVAKELINQAWQIAQELDDSEVKALVETDYGKLARDIGQWELAWKHFSNIRDYYELRVASTPRDEELARSTWGHLAIIALHLGRPQEAKELCQRSIDYFETLGTKGYLATLKYRLALAEKALGEFNEARQHLQEAIEWFERLGMKPDYAEAIQVLQNLDKQIAERVTKDYE